MLSNLISLLIIILVVILFAWLTGRAWGARRVWLRWIGIVLAGLFTVLSAFLTVVFAKGMLDVYAPKPVATVTVNIAGSPEQIARGEHLASVMCAECHTTNGTLPLSGGKDFFKEAPMPLGTMVPVNLTPGGKLQEFSDADIIRIVRTGVEPNGRWTMMGSFPAHNLSDDDLQSIIAYLRGAPPVQNETPSAEYSPLFIFFAGAGVLPLSVPTTIQPVTAPPKAPTAAYGGYIKDVMDCKGCHGPTLSADGGTFSPKNAANLTQIVPKWSKDDFFQAMRTGIDVTGHHIQPPMPWQQIGELDDIELEALYQYLHSLVPIARPAK